MTSNSNSGSDFLVEYADLTQIAYSEETVEDHETIRFAVPKTILAKLQSSAYKRQRHLFIVAVALQLGLLAGSGCVHAFTYFTGTNVVLKATPVDPRDLFRGDYLSLTYDIADLNLEKAHGYPPGEELYVVLKKNEPYWIATGISTKKPKLQCDEVAIKGKIERSWPSNKSFVHYGIEQYFIAEGQGNKIRASSYQVNVAVDRFGNAVLKSLQPAGKSAGTKSSARI